MPVPYAGPKGLAFYVKEAETDIYAIDMIFRIRKMKKDPKRIGNADFRLCGIRE